MALESLVATYGYPVVFAGALFEGETVIIAAGFLAHCGYLKLQWVILLAFLGGFTSDQVLFRVGRGTGNAVLERSPRWRLRADRVRGVLHKHQNLLMLSFRFLYGTRIVTPVVIGISRLSAKRFFWLNGAGALIWATAVGSAGYFFGQFLGVLLVDIKKHERWIALGIVAIGTGIWLFRTYLFGRGQRAAR